MAASVVLAALPEADRVWLTECVTPIVLPEEEDLYMRIREPAERESFREEFWRRREKMPD